jgi:hypothetical protein
MAKKDEAVKADAARGEYQQLYAADLEDGAAIAA